MKFLKSAVLLTLFSFLFVQANATPFTLSPQEQLEKQITELVNDAEVWGTINKDVVLKISFTINDDGEIIVLSTNNENFDLVAKSLLNYKSIDVDQKFHNKVFILPVRLSKSNR